MGVSELGEAALHLPPALQILPHCAATVNALKDAKHSSRVVLIACAAA